MFGEHEPKYRILKPATVTFTQASLVVLWVFSPLFFSHQANSTQQPSHSSRCSAIIYISWCQYDDSHGLQGCHLSRCCQPAFRKVTLCLKLTLLAVDGQHSEIPYYQSDHCKGFFPHPSHCHYVTFPFAIVSFYFFGVFT